MYFPIYSSTIAAFVTLLRPSARDPEEEKNLLLRPAVGTENTIPIDRLLRPASVIEEQSVSYED